ncbi:LOW QUALITY PROTEIN: speckle-type POZ protein B [Daphnia magna]|uniref:LOW QUALITY PROTEIN: speckle-type POZ protein B n=1 Tax=Daphnia magna TaxID=35525 RepID=UPI001E1BC0C0|nr:LOW QUALITY PROTEIN: speckle-type POZ protein B [Daphnia magna]
MTGRVAITMHIKVLLTSVHFLLLKTKVSRSSPLRFITSKKGSVHRNSSSQTKMNEIVKKTGTIQLGESFTPSLADNWCQTTSEINKTDFEWNVQLPYTQHPLPALTSSTVSSGEYCSWALNLSDDPLNINIGVNLYRGTQYLNITHRFRVRAGIANKKGDLLFPNTTLIDIKWDGSGKIFCYILQINKEELWKSDCYEKDGNFTIYCAVAVWLLKGNKSGSLPKSTSNTCHNELLQTQLEELLENKTLSDVNLNVRGRIFPAHKNILAARSKVFAAMFEHETAEKLLNNVDIQDVDPDLFQEVLVYIYSGRMSSGTIDKKAVGVLAVADKYFLDQLKAECETHLMKKMSADNCVELLALADQPHPAAHLKKYAVDFLRRSPALVKATDGWEKAKREKPLLFCELIEMLCA